MRIYTLHSIANNGLSLPTDSFESFIKAVCKRNRVVDPLEFIDDPTQDGVLLTFDDCFSDNLCNVLPILNRYNVKAIFFYTPGYDSVVNWGSAQEMRWEDKKSEIFNIPFTYMSKKELNVLRGEGHHLGFHSMSHVNLTDCSPAQLEYEICDGAKKTSLDLNYEFNFFAYPRGRFSEGMFPYIEKAGFKYAFTTQPGNVVDVSGVNKFKLPRNPAMKKYFRWL